MSGCRWRSNRLGGNYRLRTEFAGRHRFCGVAEGGRRGDGGQIFGSVESVKAVSDLYAPVSGTVTEINEALNDAAGDDQLGRERDLALQDGLDDSSELIRLTRCLMQRAYETFVSEETGH